MPGDTCPINRLDAASAASRAQYERLFAANSTGGGVGMAGLCLMPCALDLEPSAELPELHIVEASGGLSRKRRGRAGRPAGAARRVA